MRRVSRVSATGTRTPSSATTPGTTRAMNIGACTLTRRSRRLTRSPEVLVTTAEPWTRPSGGGVPRPSRCSATPVAPVTGGRTTSGLRPRWVAWPRRWRPKRGRPPDLLRHRSTRRRNTGARRPRSRASRTFVPTPCARDGSWLSWCRLSKGKGRDGGPVTKSHRSSVCT